MSFRFSRAIIRPPSSNFANGLTSAGLGVPDFALACEQHARYCNALEGAGLEFIRLPEDPVHPDATFIEDAAILSARCNVLTNPGAPSRSGEVAAIREVLSSLAIEAGAIEPPGTLDGGDICEVGEHFLIGISQRTNWDGAAQLAALLTRAGYTSACIDTRETAGILHLKSGIAALDDRRVVAIEALAGHPALSNHELVRVPAGEEYAANCVRVDNYLLVAAGFPRIQDALQEFGFHLIVLDMSEFQKMDGGLSCLSLRF